MTQMLITTNSLVMIDGDKRTTVTVHYRPDTFQKSEWLLTTNEGESKVYSAPPVQKGDSLAERDYGNMEELLSIITDFELGNPERIYDFEDTMVKNQWNGKFESAEEYAYTLVHLSILSMRHGSRHVGEGVWITRCNYCDYAVTHYGHMMRYATVGDHEVEVHEAQVAGINVGLLP